MDRCRHDGIPVEVALSDAMFGVGRAQKKLAEI
jgi:hypothetical protein